MKLHKHHFNLTKHKINICKSIILILENNNQPKTSFVYFALLLIWLQSNSNTYNVANNINISHAYAGTKAMNLQITNTLSATTMILNAQITALKCRK
jgi:hypothetical protein